MSFSLSTNKYGRESLYWSFLSALTSPKAVYIPLSIPAVWERPRSFSPEKECLNTLTLRNDI